MSGFIDKLDTFLTTARVSVEEVSSRLLHWLLSTTPDFWLAIFTLGLLIVAALAARIGLRTLKTASETFRLEAAPYLIVTQRTGMLDKPPEPYVITAPGKGKGIVARLRLWDPRKDHPRGHGTGSYSTRTNMHYGGRPNWSGVVLEVKNVGRSPAVGVRIDVIFDLTAPDNLNYDVEAADPAVKDFPSDADSWVEGRDYPIRLNKTGGFGLLFIASIMTGESVFVEIQNRYAANAKLRIGRQSSISSLDGTGRLVIPVHISGESIEIPFRSVRTR